MTSSSSSFKSIPPGALEESLEDLYDSAPCGYLTTTIDGRILKVNKTLAEWLGLEYNELVGAKRIQELLTTGGRMFYETHLNVLLRIKKSVDEIALDFLCKDGRALPTFINARQKRDESGEPLLNRFTVFNASERLMYERQLLATRDLLQTTLSSIGDGVIATDAQANITFMNPIAENLSGWASEEVTGKAVEEVLKLTREGSFEPIENPILLALREKVVVALVNPTVLHNRNGTEIAIDDSAAPIRDSNGEVTGAVLVFRDISTRRSAERALAAAYEEAQRRAGDLRDAHEQLQMQATELERSNEDLSQFAHMASHDLRSPLNTIVQFTQLLDHRYAPLLGDDGKHLIEHVTQAAKRMAALIDDLLSFASASVGSGQSPVEVDAASQLSFALLNLASLIQTSSAVVTYDTLPTVNISATNLGQIFQNLIGNAIHYRSAARPEIHISAAGQGNEWLFSCRDNGMGIAPAHQTKIFEPFRRLHGPDRPGSGIGLAVCKKLVERYGGRIWVESQENQGSTFYFTLPRQSG